jgi:hypothetical protein
MLLHPFVAPLLCLSSTLAACCVTSHHAAASHLHAPSPLIALPLLIAPLSHLLSGWLSHHLLSRCHLSSTCTSTSHCTAASHRTPLAPLVRLVVASPLVMLPPPVHMSLCLSLHRRLSSHPSCASCPAGYHVISCHAAAFRPFAPPPLIALPPFILPLLHLLFGWLSHHLSSCRRLPSACTSPLIAPLLQLLSAWLLHHLLSHRRCLLFAGTSTSHCTATSGPRMVWLVKGLLLESLVRGSNPQVSDCFWNSWWGVETPHGSPQPTWA